MNEAIANWLFAPDAASAAQARTILDNRGREPRDGWLADTYQAFAHDQDATLDAYLRRLIFYRRLALQGKIAG